MPLGVRVEVDTSPIPDSLSELQTRQASLKAVRAGIKIVNAIVKAAAPKRLGHLKRAQGTKAVKGKRGKTGSFAVQGAKTKYRRMVRAGRRAETSLRRVIPALYDHLVIGGVKPHSIRKGSKTGQLRKGKWSKPVGQGKGKAHPGHRANPYRRHAYDAVAPSVGKEMLRVLGVEVQKMLAKNAAKIKKKFAV